MLPLVGQTISHYRILDTLGTGGMGVVYRAEDTRLHRFVALKFLPLSIKGDDEVRERFVREARASAAIGHPNIATLFDIEENEDHPFIALELIEGETLDQKLKSGPLRLEEAVGFSLQIARGIQAAHEKGIVHRDLTARNIMVSSGSQVKILDFGLASLRGVSAMTKPGTTMGTAGYMSPEQLKGEPVDPRTDIYSLGVVIYEMVAGRRPFQGEYEAALAYQTIHEEPAPLTTIRSDVPAELERITQKLLQKDPIRRYQSAAEVLVDLERLRDSVNVTDVQALPPRRRSFRAARPLIYAGTAVLFLILLWVGLQLVRRDTVAPIASLAVLPLENLSHDPEQNYFADGMTEALIVELSQIKALKVTSRTSSMRYKTVRKTTPEIARELNVEGLIEGSVQRAGDKVGISVRLIDARTDHEIWSSSSERDLRDILSLQRDVARRIVNEIQIALTPEQKARLSQKTEVNPAAYQLYLRGRYFLDRRSREDDAKAIASFKQAIELDPRYGRAYAGLADCYLFQAPLPRHEAMPAAKAAAFQALEIDSTLSEAHATLGFVRMNYDWDWTGAERELTRAIDLNPNYPVARQFYGGFLTFTGRADEGLREIRKALELDPLSLALNWYLGFVLYLDRRYAEAAAQYRRTLDLQPGYELAINGLGDVYVQQGMYRKADSLYRTSANPEGRLINLSAMAGRKKEAENRLRKALNDPDRQGLTSYDIAKAYTILQDPDRAMTWLARGYKERDFGMFFLKVDPAFDPLRKDASFAALLADLGFK